MKIKKEGSKMPEQFKIDIFTSHQEKKLSDYQYYQLVCCNNLVNSLSAVARNLNKMNYDLMEYLKKSSK